MKLNLILLTGILALFTSCKGQNTASAGKNGAPVQNPITPGPLPAPGPMGDTVAEIGKSAWIVFQDSNGNYWFGSDGNGVYRYGPVNGREKTIVQFTTRHGLCGNRIREIQEDGSGNIYFTTMDGICKFNGQGFTTLTPVTSGSAYNEWKLAPGDMWFKEISGKGGPYRYDGKNLYHLKFPKHAMHDAFYAQFPNVRYSPYDVYHIYKDHKGTIWFGTSNFGICRFDGTRLSWLYEEHLTLVPGGGSFGIRSIIGDKAGKFWFCNNRYRFTIAAGDTVIENHRLMQYEKESVQAGKYFYFMSVVEDDAGALWMATYNEGVWKYNGSNFTHYPVKNGNKDVTVFSIYKDKEGTLWLGTHENGVFKFNGSRFEPFKP